jgi:hypothetical protein
MSEEIKGNQAKLEREADRAAAGQGEAAAKRDRFARSGDLAAPPNLSMIQVAGRLSAAPAALLSNL